MKKTIKLLKLLLAITSCLFFYSCTDSPAYFEYAPVPDTAVVQDLKALGSVRDLMQPK